MEHLGYNISFVGNLFVSAKRAEAVKKWPVPKT
jgi:hypothetical protein